MKILNEEFATYHKDYEAYAPLAKALILRIKEDKAAIHQFDSFNRRFKISHYLDITFHDALNIKREDTRQCYTLMLKISDLWFAFEQLLRVAQETFTIKPRNKVDPFPPKEYQKLGLSRLTSTFQKALWGQVLDTPAHRRAIYQFIGILKKNTRGKTKDYLGELHNRISKREDFAERHVLALIYGLRNLYVHCGITATMGDQNYRQKRKLLELIFDALSIICILIARAYCQEKLNRMAQHA